MICYILSFNFLYISGVFVTILYLHFSTYSIWPVFLTNIKNLRFPEHVARASLELVASEDDFLPQPPYKHRLLISSELLQGVWSASYVIIVNCHADWSVAQPCMPYGLVVWPSGLNSGCAPFPGCVYSIHVPEIRRLAWGVRSEMAQCR